MIFRGQDFFTQNLKKIGPFSEYFGLFLNHIGPLSEIYRPKSFHFALFTKYIPSYPSQRVTSAGKVLVIKNDYMKFVYFRNNVYLCNHIIRIKYGATNRHSMDSALCELS